MPYSQHGEEEVIVEVLQAGSRVGHFLDIGAYDGKTFSNTYRLTELGWSGVCVEPSPSVFPALLKLHADNPRVEVVNAALGENAGFFKFHDANGDALSTFVQEHRDRWKAAADVPFRTLWVYAVTWEMIFQRFSLQFDFINLDVEGLSALLFLRMPLQALSAVRAICVEHDGVISSLNQHAQKFGFKYHWHNGENIIFTR